MEFDDLFIDEPPFDVDLSDVLPLDHYLYGGDPNELFVSNFTVDTSAEGSGTSTGNPSEKHVLPSFLPENAPDAPAQGIDLGVRTRAGKRSSQSRSQVPATSTHARIIPASKIQPGADGISRNIPKASLFAIRHIGNMWINTPCLEADVSEMAKSGTAMLQQIETSFVQEQFGTKNIYLSDEKVLAMSVLTCTRRGRGRIAKVHNMTDNEMMEYDKYLIEFNTPVTFAPPVFTTVPGKGNVIVTGLLACMQHLARNPRLKTIDAYRVNFEDVARYSVSPIILYHMTQ